MSRKIRKVTLLKDIGLPENFIAKADTEGKLSESIAGYWRFYNEKDDFYSYKSDDLKRYPDYFQIEYETPKIKSVALKLKYYLCPEGIYHDPLSNLNFHVDYILQNPEKFIIEYEEDSE